MLLLAKIWVVIIIGWTIPLSTITSILSILHYTIMQEQTLILDVTLIMEEIIKSHTLGNIIYFYLYINHCTNKSYNCITNEGITAPNCSRIRCYWIQKAVFVTWAANTLIRKQVCKSVLAFVCFAKISVHLHRWCELDVLSLFLHVMSCGLGERVL